jgi:hypothetical protein
VVEKIKFANGARRCFAPGKRLQGESFDALELAKNPRLAIGYIVAPPRMALYMEYSSRVYGVYLRFVSPMDVHPYSIDEVFIYATPYLKTCRLTAPELALQMVRAVLAEWQIRLMRGERPNNDDLMAKGSSEELSTNAVRSKGELSEQNGEGAEQSGHGGEHEHDAPNDGGRDAGLRDHRDRAEVERDG